VRFTCPGIGSAGECSGTVGFFDLDKRLEAISAKGDPLEALKAVLPFESFRAEIEAVVRPAPAERKSNAGRKPFDAVMMFKVLVLQTLYNLADEQVEYQISRSCAFSYGAALKALGDPTPIGTYESLKEFRLLCSGGCRVDD
jgi:hypothetical protein